VLPLLVGVRLRSRTNRALRGVIGWNERLDR
jgi:hypothetical protein